ncbi:MAG: sulfotransferase family protein [Phycisphaerales bacterium]
MPSPPVFLVGAERSGTTLLGLMLGHHPLVAWAGEFTYAVDRIDAPNAWPDTGEYAAWIARDRVFRAGRFAIDHSCTYPELVDSFLSQCRRRAGKPLAGATVHRNFDRLLRIWPDARLIHLVRDPRDVARSVVAMGWSGTMWHGVDRWLHAEAAWERLRDATPESQRCEVRFEELIADAPRTLQRVCTFLGVGYSPAMLEYPGDTTYHPPDPRLVRQWERRCTTYEVQLAEARLGSWLAARGYEPSGRPALRVSAAHKQALRVRTRIRGIQNRVHKFGWRLVLAEYITRRLHFQEWNAKLIRLLDIKESKFLK